jgi:hypothetical protein
MFYQNDLAMRNTADATGGKPTVVCSQTIIDVSAVNLLVAFYNIHGKKRKVLFFCSVSDTTRDMHIIVKNHYSISIVTRAKLERVAIK